MPPRSPSDAPPAKPRESLDEAEPRPRLGNTGTVILVVCAIAAILLGLDYWHSRAPNPLRAELAVCWQKYAAAASLRTAPIDLFSKSFGDFDQAFTPANERAFAPLWTGDTPSQIAEQKKNLAKNEAEHDDVEKQYALLDVCRTWLLSYRQQMINEQNGTGPTGSMAIAEKHIQGCLARHTAELGINDQYNP